MRTLKPLETIYWLRLALGITAALICVGYGLVSGTISTNLILNPSVETGETGAATPHDWVSFGNGTEWNMSYAKTGSGSIRINITNATAEWRGKVGPINEGYTYQVYGSFTGEVTAGQFFLTVRWSSDLEGLGFIAESNISILVGSYPQWSRLGDNFAAPKEAKSCEIVFRAVDGSGDLYGDDFEVRRTESWTSFSTGFSIALIIYLASYYIIKLKFMNKVEKPRKLITTGIGSYFLAWIVLWILMYTIIAGSP